MNEDLALAGTQVSAHHCSFLLPVPLSKVPSAMWLSRISRVHHGRDSVYRPCRLSNLSSKCLKTLKVHVGYTEIQAMRKSDKLTWSESSCAQMVKLKPTFFFISYFVQQVVYTRPLLSLKAPQRPKAPGHLQLRVAAPVNLAVLPAEVLVNLIFQHTGGAQGLYPGRGGRLHLR